MFSHVFASVSDFERTLHFYTAVMDSLGVELRVCERERPWADWHSAGEMRPFYVICKLYDEKPHHPGNGQMIAFSADSRTAVKVANEIALANGGSCEGPPGLRPPYHENYYGAYFRDPDGNKLCIACHTPAYG